MSDWDVEDWALFALALVPVIAITGLVTALVVYVAVGS